MLGPLTVSCDGRVRTLPPSRKVRALLAYLALAPRAVPRARLCALFWEAACDSRAELRWHLSKLRAVLGADRLIIEDDLVRLRLEDSEVDALDIRRAMRGDFTALTIQRLNVLRPRFRGEFLEGLEVDRCPEFTAWVLAERRRFRAWRVLVLQRLALETPGDEAIVHAEQWLAVSPLDERAHVCLLELLARRGRIRDGEEHLAVTQRLFRCEGLDGAPLSSAWHSATGRRRTSDAHDLRDREQACEYFLLGRQHLGRMMRHGLEQGRRMFELALQVDAGYGPAWAGLAIAHACLHEWFETGGTSLGLAERASRRALDAAPRLAESHVARAFVRSQSGHWDDAVAGFEAAIRINPYLFDSYYYFARAAFARGDTLRAADMFRLAGEARPDDFQSAILLALPLNALGQQDAARDAVRLGIRRAELALAVNECDGRALSLGAGALLDDDQTERAHGWSKRALDLYPDDTSALVNIACVYAKSEAPARALDLLERVFARGCGKRDWVLNDPDYNPLRREPRFRALVGKLK